MTDAGDTGLSRLAELGEVLAALRQEGRYIDSGQFGLEGLKALAKLSRHQIGDSGLWLVKLFQAAVCAKATCFDVQFARRHIKVSFRPQTDWQADELLELVVSGQLPANRALLHLVTGLRSCAGRLTERLSWSCGETRVVLDGDRLRVEPQSPSPVFELEATRPARSYSFPQLLGSSLRHVVGQTVSEYEALQTRCWASPIPITVDGRPLSRGYGAVVRSSVVVQGQMRVSRQTSQVQACLGVRHLTSPTSRPELVSLASHEHDASVELTSPLYAYETFLHWPARVSYGAVAVHASPLITASVELVLDGVVVETHSLETFQARPSKLLGLQASTRTLLRPRLIFAVRPEEVDLSGFQTHGIDIKALVMGAVPELVELLHEIASHGKKLTYLVTTRPPKLLTPLTFPLRVMHVPVYRRVMMEGLEELLVAIKDAVERPVDHGPNL